MGFIFEASVWVLRCIWEAMSLPMHAQRLAHIRLAERAVRAALREKLVTQVESFRETDRQIECLEEALVRAWQRTPLGPSRRLLLATYRQQLGRLSKALDADSKPTGAAVTQT
jgi:hypothetical protein